MKRKTKNKKTKFDRIIAWLHLWPSIISGIILIVVCMTGTLVVYGDEIMELTAGKARFVPVGKHRVSAEEIMQSLHRFDPALQSSELVFFKDPTRSIRIRAFNVKQKKLCQVYMDPYTGNVLKADPSIYFFFITAHLHANLLSGNIGLWMVILSTIIFLISCITGLILWWPKRWNRSTRLASFTVRWKAKFKRLNYDLHNVLGFYSLLLCIVLGFTGLMISFQGITAFTAKTLGASPVPLEQTLPKADPKKQALDLVPFAYRVLEQEYPDKKAVSIWTYALDKSGAYTFTSGVPGLKSVENMDLSIYNKYTGERIPLSRGHEIHEKTENSVWQLHMGQWWGQIGKLTTFLVGLIATSLPITGFIIWWGKRKKVPKQRNLSPV